MVITEKLLKDNGFIYEFGDYIKRDGIDIDFMQGQSNTPGREWCVAVANDSHKSIGCCDIGTTEQFEFFLKALDINIKDVLNT